MQRKHLDQTSIPDKYEMKNLKEQRLSVIIDCNVKKVKD